jgi:DMSO/TMAO reductase YedYZ heme-binding membrane subunit
MAHGAGALLVRKNKELMDVFDPALWDFGTYWGWGLLAAALMVPLLATSNVWSMKVLKKWWKPLQRLSYLAFLATGIHIFMIHYEAGPLVVVGFWGILWGLVYLKKSN